MPALIILNKGTGNVAIDPGEVVEVHPSYRSPGWCLVTLRNGHEHSVEGFLEDVTAKINAGKWPS